MSPLIVYSFMIIIFSLNIFQSFSQKSACIWNDTLGSGSVLDLRSLYGRTISYCWSSVTPYNGDCSPNSTFKLDAPDEFIYNDSYTVCRNGIDCGDGHMYMDGIMVDVFPGGCAISHDFWDPTVEPIYNKSLNEWKFTYTGSDCLYTQKTKFSYIWICNQSIPDVRIVDFYDNNCEGAFTFQSALACV